MNQGRLPAALPSAKPRASQLLHAGLKGTLAAWLIAYQTAPAWADVQPTVPVPINDFTWLNGSNYQTTSPLKTGPLTWTLMVDNYYSFDFNHPSDHTIFPATTAPRHNEFNLNLAALGLEVTEQDGLYGKLLLQAGNYVDTITGQDPTISRGLYTGLSSLRFVQQAYAGHRLDVGGGLNVMAGIFPAYIGLDSYIPQENWNYSHSIVSDFTPYYLSGVTAQFSAAKDINTQLWLVNGWQSLSKYGEGFGLGYSFNWRPSDRLSLTHNVLSGNFDSDQSRTRVYTDNTVQWKYAVQPWPGLQYLALAGALDGGYETASTVTNGLPATWMGGASLLQRIQFDDRWATTMRLSTFYDPQRLVALSIPGVSAVPDGLQASECTITLDFRASSWMLYRLEYRHDFANVPYIAGPGGITSNAGNATFSPDLRTSDDRITANTTIRY